MKEPKGGQINRMRRIFRSLILAIALTPLTLADGSISSAGSEPTDAAGALEQVRRLESGQPYASLKLLDDWLASNRPVPDQLRHAMEVRRLHLLCVTKQFQTAERICLDLLAKHPDSGDFHSWLGSILQWQGRNGEALIEARKATEIGPNNAAYRVNYAETLLLAGKPGKALEQLLLAERLNTAGGAELYLRIALVYDRAGHLQRAREMIAKSVAADPKHPSYRLYQGFIEGKAGNKDKARDCVASAIAGSSDENTLIASADFLNQLAMPERAVPICNQVIKLNPRATNAYVLRAKCARDMDSGDLGLADLDKAVALTPEAPEIWAQRSQTLLVHRRFSEAMGSAQRAASLNPHTASYAHQLASCQYQLKLFKSAIETCNKIIAEHPTFGSAYLTRGDCYAAMGNNWQAIDDFTLANMVAPHEPAALMSRAQSFVALRLPSNALSDLNELIHANPAHSTAHEWRARVFHELGAEALARADEKKALQLEKSQQKP